MFLIGVDAVEKKKLLGGGEIVMEGFQEEMDEKEAWFLVPKGNEALLQLWMAVEGHRGSRVSRVIFLRIFLQKVACSKILPDGSCGESLSWVHVKDFLEKRNAQMNVVCKGLDGDNVIFAV